MEKDSTAETSAHILRVRELIERVRDNLYARATIHDDSKTKSPEKEMFDEVTGALRGLTYGSLEYKEQLAKIKPALDHHYAANSHHPEHYSNGIFGMSLLDLLEMFCDWKAATERHVDGSLEKSIQINRGRFHMDEQLVAIFENTRKEMGW